MDTFQYLGTKRFNDFQMPYPDLTDPTAGPSLAPGIIGNRHKLSEVMALKLSNTNIGTLRNGMYQVVRTDPTAATIANYVAGRALFWADPKKFVVTYVASTLSLFAGICLGPVSVAGNLIHIAIAPCDVGALYAAALTKAVPALNDPVILSIAANLGTFDVQLDATAFSNANLKLLAGRVNEAPVVNQVKRIILTQTIQVFDEGIV